MKKTARLMAFVMAAVLPVQAYAFECNVKINYLLVYSHGTSTSITRGATTSP